MSRPKASDRERWAAMDEFTASPPFQTREAYMAAVAAESDERMPDVAELAKADRVRARLEDALAASPQPSEVVDAADQ